MTDPYLVWSNQHRAWWAIGSRGYTSRLELAARFTREQAVKIAAEAIPGQASRMGLLPELPVRLADITAMVAAYHIAIP